jgi:hypothetical protein
MSCASGPTRALRCQRTAATYDEDFDRGGDAPRVPPAPAPAHRAATATLDAIPPGGYTCKK